MRKEIFTCDICHREKKPQELARLEIRSASGINIRDANGYFGTGHLLDVCPDCLKKYGFDVEKKQGAEREKQAEANQKTLEDKILDILSDLGVVFEN